MANEAAAGMISMAHVRQAKENVHCYAQPVLNLRRISLLIGKKLGRRKFHLPAHIAECNLNFSFNLTKHVGRTDGEAPEQGASLWKKLVTAAPMAIEQAKQFESFSSTISSESLVTFRSQVEAWEDDISEPNPFKPTIKYMSEQEVKLAFAKEAAAEAAKDSATIHADMHPSELIAQGLQLEDQQQRLRTDIAALGQHPTPDQLRVIQEASNRLQRRINTWIQAQELYLPHIALLRDTDLSAATAKNGGIPPEPRIEEINLYLPSSLSDKKVPDKFNEYEWRLRESQAYGSLHDIRQNFRIKTHFVKHKKAKIIYAATKYRRARTALVELSSKPRMDKLCKPTWQEDLKELHDYDLRGMSEGLLNETAGKRTLSWIWLAEGIQEGEENERTHEALRIEWCHMRARVMRFSEEVQLLEEEMRRVSAFLAWQAEWWGKRGDDLSHVSDPMIREGMMAYRERQAYLRLALRDRFESLWKNKDKIIDSAKYNSSLVASDIDSDDEVE
ncbi:hypothetical protein BJ912DRAFT_1020430 [Pholiota molesta]|nr:hypothetical protein BJ912DRAFT_1020430 [Pholiota molesta]